VSEAAQALLQAAATAEVGDYYSRADALAAAVRCAARAPDSFAGVLSEARTQAAALTDPNDRATALAALADEVPDPDLGARMAEAFAAINSIPADTRLDSLVAVLHYVPDAFRNDVLRNLQVTARAVEPASARASALRKVAVLMPEPDQEALLHEAHEITPVVQAETNLDDAQFVQAITALASGSSPGGQSEQVNETLSIARDLGPYDRACALVGLILFLPVTQQPEIATEALNAARQVTDDTDKADALTAVIPYFRGGERDQILIEATECVRAIDVNVFFRNRGIWADEGNVVDTDDWLPAGLHDRARLAALLSALTPPGELKEQLAREATDAIYANVLTQADTVIAASPNLPETAVRQLLASIRAVAGDPIRARVVATLLTRLADLESPHSAEKKAADIWGRSVPLAELTTQARPTADTTEAPADESLVGDDTSDNTFTATIEAYPDWLDQLFNLIPEEPIIRALLSPPPTDSIKEEIERQVLDNYVTHTCAELPRERILDVLGKAAEFMHGGQWTRAKAALVSRLVDLDRARSAAAEMQATWPQSPPAQVFAAVADILEPDMRRRLASSVLASAWEIADPTERAAALGALVPHIPAPDREQARDYIEHVIQDQLTNSHRSRSVQDLASLLYALPPSRRLPLWQDTLNAAAHDTRRQLLKQLPTIIGATEGFAVRQLRGDITKYLLEIKRQKF
jgi:hypothetical protein